MQVGFRPKSIYATGNYAEKSGSANYSGRLGRSHHACFRVTVDMHISCALEKIEDIPGAWTTLRCTGNGRVAPNVLAWRKDDSHLNIDSKNYEIRTLNKSSQLLVIKDYTMKHLGKYGCIVGIGINRSLCTMHVTGLFDYKVAKFHQVFSLLF